MCFPRFGNPFVEVAAALRADALHCRHDDGDGRFRSGLLHHDVEEFFGAEIGGESRFVHDVVGEAQRHFLRDDAAGAVRDICERTCVHKRRRSIGRLREIWQDRFGEQRHHSADGVQFAGADGLSVACHADDDGFEAVAQIFAIFGEREDCHDFAGGGDDEIRFAIGAVAFAADVDLNAAQRAIVHVHGARPGDLIGIEIEFVAVEKMRVDQRGEKIVRAGNCVKVAVEVKIDFRGRLDLRKAAARGAAFHAEDGTERRFARCDHCAFSDVRESLGQSDRGDGFAFAGNGGRCRGDENHFAARFRERGIVQEVRGGSLRRRN